MGWKPTIQLAVLVSVLVIFCCLTFFTENVQGTYSMRHKMWVYRRTRRVHAGIRKRVHGYGHHHHHHHKRLPVRQYRSRRTVYKRVRAEVLKPVPKVPTKEVVYSRRYHHRVYYNRIVRPYPGSVTARRKIQTRHFLPPIYLPPILPNGCGGQCGRNAVCLGGHTCVCRPTYQGNPLTVCHPGGGPCGNRCGIRARCLTGTRKCTCNPGYYGNPLVACFPGYKCRRGCGRNAICDRQKGVCKCRRGYIGNPHYQCVSLVGCRGGCGPNAVCNRARHACVCVKGTGPNPVVGCKPRNGCKRRCGSNAICNERTLKCQCRRGFHGNPHKSCVALPCEGRCGKNAACRNGACVCINGCAGDPYSKCFYLQTYKG